MFRIPRQIAVDIYRKGARRVYIAIVQDLARDGHIDEADTHQLNTVAKHFRLNEHEQTQSLKDSLGAIVQSRLDDIISDRLISDAEWHDLELLCEGLGIKPSMSPTPCVRQTQDANEDYSECGQARQTMRSMKSSAAVISWHKLTNPENQTCIPIANH